MVSEALSASQRKTQCSAANNEKQVVRPHADLKNVQTREKGKKKDLEGSWEGEMIAEFIFAGLFVGSLSMTLDFDNSCEIGWDIWCMCARACTQAPHISIQY